MRSVWRDGSRAAKRGAAFLDVSEPMFLAIAKQQKWPRKRIPGKDGGRGKVVYPLALIRSFLEACQDAAPLGAAK